MSYFIIKNIILVDIVAHNSDFSTLLKVEAEESGIQCKPGYVSQETNLCYTETLSKNQLIPSLDWVPPPFVVALIEAEPWTFTQ